MEEEQINNFLSLPTLVHEKIINYLGPHEYLSLRRVCKTTRNWVKESAWLSSMPNKWKQFSLTIEEGNDGWKSFGSCLAMGLPISSFYLKNKSVEFYSASEPQDFSKKYGLHVKILRVENFYTLLTDKEFQWFDSFPALEEIEFENIHAQNRPWIFSKEPQQQSPVFPEVFQRIKSLKLGKVYASGPLHGLIVNSKYHWDLLNACPNLEHFRYPNLVDRQPPVPGECRLYHFVWYLIQSQDRHQGTSRKFKSLDLVNYRETPGTRPDLIEEYFNALVRCTRAGVKVLNVDAGDLGHVWDEINWDPRQVCIQLECIESIENYAPVLRLLPLNNLKELKIVNVTSTLDTFILQPIWPSLKTVILSLDSTTELSTFWPFFWPQVERVVFGSYGRQGVENLSITFAPELKARQEWERCATMINSREIAKNFVGVKKLKIVGWEGINKAFLRFWSNMEQLEEVWLEDCVVLGNVGFIGKDPNDPVFLKLKSLKKLTLKLDGMPKITDRLFAEVISKMRLKELNLISDFPLQRISETTITSLLEGQFALTVERFPFHTWSVSNISKERFDELFKKFRSIL